MDSAMATQPSTTGIRTFQTVVFGGALHPELFELKSRRVFRKAEYDIEAWVMEGAHAVRFVQGPFCCTELVIDEGAQNLPTLSLIEAVPCPGESEFEHRFKTGKLNYMTTVQTEALNENLYHSTLQEMDDYVGEVGAIHHRWKDTVGDCLSLLDVECLNREVQIQGFHLIARGGIVLRTQTILERCHEAVATGT
ncbi:MAG: hypothetical protein ACI89L_002050 [Phycisphaerales bacterium]|jgi:hypothetical protein